MSLYYLCCANLYFNSAACTGNAESWFDPQMVVESDCDDDFYSVQDGKWPEQLNTCQYQW